MTYSVPIPLQDLMIEMRQSALLASLKLQMQGLAALFAGDVPSTPRTDLAQQETDTQAGCDTLPV